MTMKRAERGGAVTWLMGILVVAILLLAGYVWVVLHWSYSQGERAGWVQKLSHKGWFCKTWEGELAMIAVPGALPEKFFFTVWDDGVAESLNRHMGQRVALHYEEKVGIPTDCFGESRYIVTKVTTVEGAPPPPGGAQPVPGAPLPVPVPTAPGSTGAPQPATPSAGPASPIPAIQPPTPPGEPAPGASSVPAPPSPPSDAAAAPSPAPDAGAAQAPGIERRP